MLGTQVKPGYKNFGPLGTGFNIACQKFELNFTLGSSQMYQALS